MAPGRPGACEKEYEMIISQNDVYAENIAAVASGQVGDVIDHGAPVTGYDAKGVGSGAVPRFFNVVVREDFADCTSQQFVLESSDVEDFATGVKTMATSPVISLAALVKSAMFEIPVSAGGQQYTRCRNVNGGTTATAGKVDLFTTY